MTSFNLLDKESIRHTAFSRRNQIPASERARKTEAFTKRFLDTVTIQQDAIVAAYWPVRGELDVLPLVRNFLSRGIICALPQTAAPGMPLIFRAWREDTPMVAGAFGILEPDPSVCDIVDPDVIIAPLLAFDTDCVRLGSGSGFYDRTIAYIRSTRNVVAIGAGFDIQRMDQIPSEPHDVVMDMIITEAAVYNAKDKTA